MVCLEATRVVVNRRSRGRVRVDFDDEAGGRLMAAQVGIGRRFFSLFKMLHRYRV